MNVIEKLHSEKIWQGWDIRDVSIEYSPGMHHARCGTGRQGKDRRVNSHPSRMKLKVKT